MWLLWKLVEQAYRLIVGNRWSDHDVVTVGPVSWGCNLEVRCQLKRIDDTQNLIKVPAVASARVTKVGTKSEAPNALLVGEGHRPVVAGYRMESASFFAGFTTKTCRH